MQGSRLPMARDHHYRQLMAFFQILTRWPLGKARMFKGTLHATGYGSCRKPASAKIPVRSWGAINLSRRRVSTATPAALVAF
jgi:hypothetical protein